MARTWSRRVVSEDDFHLNALVPVEQRASGNPGASRPPSQRLYIAAEAGVAYRSDDAGKTWTELPSPYAGSWFGGLALDEEQVVLTGLRGHLFRSEDAGETWTQVHSGTTATLTGAIRPASDSIVVTGLEGSVLTSQDGGRSVFGPQAAVARGNLGRAAARRRRSPADRRVRRPAHGGLTPRTTP